VPTPCSRWQRRLARSRQGQCHVRKTYTNNMVDQAKKTTGSMRSKVSRAMRMTLPLFTGHHPHLKVRSTLGRSRRRGAPRSMAHFCERAGKKRRSGTRVLLGAQPGLHRKPPPPINFETDLQASWVARLGFSRYGRLQRLGMGALHCSDGASCSGNGRHTANAGRIYSVGTPTSIYQGRRSISPAALP